MARLLVLKDGQRIREFEAHPEKEWILGRSENADFVLEGERGISRQHLKISFVDGQWQAENLSRYGELYQDNKKTSLIPLEDGTRFEIPPFEFVFQEPTSNQISNQLAPAEDFSERTRVGSIALTPFLKICDADGQVVQVFRLEGHAWTAGRDTMCPLYIDNQKFSRRHFEIKFEMGSYFIRDLKSSNGTVVNGQVISSTEWTPLRSGDVISIVDWSLYFELRDAAFEEKLQEIPAELNQMPYEDHDSQSPSPISLAGISMGTHPLPAPEPPAKKKFNVVHIAIAVILLASLGFYLMDEAPKETPGPSPTGKKMTAFEKLKPEQQQYVKDRYRLAEKLYKEGRFEMARQELIKLHDIIPSFESSQELAKFAEIGFQTQQEQLRAQKEEQARSEMEEKIKKVTANCRAKLGPNIEMATLEECLMPAISLNPEHPEIVALKAKAEQMIAERLEKSQKRAEYQSLVRKQQSLYDRAAKLLKEGKPLEAIDAFEKVVSSKLPDPKNLKSEARKQISLLQQNLTDAQAKFEAEADQAVKKGDLKSAILTLRKAIDINPNNESLQGRANSLMGDLRKQMQVLYQEGVLEESVGEVETAKGKWKKIIDLSLPDEDYYKKARTKLKKYGIE